MSDRTYLEVYYRVSEMGEIRGSEYSKDTSVVNFARTL